MQLWLWWSHNSPRYTYLYVVYCIDQLHKDNKLAPDARGDGHPLGVRINSLAPERSECDSKNVIFNLVLLIGIFRSSHDNALRWMPQDLIDDKSRLVQIHGAVRQLAITWAYVDSFPCHLVASQGHNELSDGNKLTAWCEPMISLANT